MSFWLILLTNLALVFILIAVHETGHYLAGLTAGIPHGDMRIRLLTFPQHVAIRDGEAWLSPTQDFSRYIEQTRRHLTSRAAAFRWVAGGVLLEAVFASVVCVLAVQAGWTFLAFWTAAMSLGMYLVNVLLMDVPWAILRRHPFGDTSGLWNIAPLPALILTTFMVLIRGLLVWYALR
jgi:hypothetical protein